MLCPLSLQKGGRATQIKQPTRGVDCTLGAIGLFANFMVTDLLKRGHHDVGNLLEDGFRLGHLATDTDVLYGTHIGPRENGRFLVKGL